jgi:hypothetical protein
MRAWWIVLALVLVCGCGGPVLQNAPHPDPGIVAAAAAAAATAATLADPDAAAKHQEQKHDSDDHKPRDVQVNQNVPPDVLDRLDKAEKEKQGSGSGSAAGPH